jgi:hypothetical protein
VVQGGSRPDGGAIAGRSWNFFPEDNLPVWGNLFTASAAIYLVNTAVDRLE